MNSFFNFLSIVGNKMDTIEAIELIYTIKAWIVLSEEGKLDSSEVVFNQSEMQSMDAEALSHIFDKLAAYHKVFELYTSKSNRIKSIDQNKLRELLHFVKESKDLPRVNDAFYSTKHFVRDYAVSNQIAQLGVKLLNGVSDTIYVPFTNGFAYAYATNKKICAENQITRDALVAELMNIIDCTQIEFHLTNALENPSYIESNKEEQLRQFKLALSFPPFSMRGRIDLSKDKYHRFKVHKGSILDVAHFEHILAQTKGKAVVLMSVGFTYRAGVEEEFRAYLVENNWLEAVIQLPPNLHSATSIETTFFIVNKQKIDHRVQFINLKHEQFFTKEGRQIVFKDIDELVDIYRDRSEIENISTLVEPETIKAFNYSLAIDRYILSSEAKEIEKKLSSYQKIALQDIADIRRSQLFKDEEDGKEVYELSPSDFALAGFTMECGKLKHLGEQSKKYETYKLQPYDILLSSKGTVGKVALIGEIKEPLIASQAIQVIRLKNEGDIKTDAIVLYMFLKSDIGQAMLKQLVAGVAMPQISTKEIKQLEIPLFSTEEKEHIVNNFNKEIKMQEEIEQLKSKIDEIHHNILGEK